ncbi:MAG: SpoIID/LytB domain-containing protein, partial [Desulfobacteraceae bacterium]|nr:SpoIID/LytB domain-containing protein [Desulfobacteraceae bacterium]
KKESNLAVDETRGQVITYDGKLIVAYFHSSSGGHTEDSKNVWSADLPYLKGIPDSFSANIPNGEWRFFVSYNDMQNCLNKYGLNIGQISGLSAGGKSRSGRLLGVRVIAKNETTELKSNNFRIKVGATELKSTLLKITPNHDGILFTGKGYGHGVGMSQWGANMMAQKGFDYQDILKHYYQSVKIVALSSH